MRRILVRVLTIGAGLSASFFLLSHESGSGVILGQYSLRLLFIETAVIAAHLALLWATFRRPFVLYIVEGGHRSKWWLLSAVPPLAALFLGLAETILPVFGHLLFDAFVWWFPLIWVAVLVIVWDAIRPSIWAWALALLATGVSAGLVLDSRSYWAMMILLMVSAVLTILVLNDIFKARWSGASLARRQNILLSLSSLVLLLFLLEIGFKLFYAEPSGYIFTLADRSWMSRHWKPVNTLGYRDREWTPDDVRDRQIILFSGDSFVAGLGIEQADDRMSSLLNGLLGDDYAVMVVAEQGWETPDELTGLETYPYSPDAVVLVYFVNDIGTAARQYDIESQFGRYVAPRHSIVSRSYFINFVYYRLTRVRFDRIDNTYMTDLHAMYANPRVWATHQAQLEAIVDWTEAQCAPLYVVLMPILADIPASQDMVDQVETFFLQQGVQTLNLADEFAGDDPRTLTVNRFDYHANEATHARIADLIYSRFDREPVPCTN